MTRKIQIDRALRALTVDGHYLVCYLECARKELSERRAKADPEDKRINTELFAEINLLDRIITDWSLPKERMEGITEELKKLQIVLDNH